MAKSSEARREPTYSLGAVTRLTGLSSHVLRAWERRYGAVRPLRSAGGTRRYRESDVSRLRLLRQAVDAGHPIRDVAGLDDADIEQRLRLAPRAASPDLEPVVAALDALDAAAAERQLSTLLAALGPRRFADEVAIPLLHTIGERWHQGETAIASEHLASALLRNLLGGALRVTTAARSAPPLLFTTLEGDRHELGALVAALIAADAGGNPVFLGPDLPAEEVADAARTLGAAAVVVGAYRERADEAQRALRELRARLPAEVDLWVGGSGSARLRALPGVERLEGLPEVEQKVQLLAARRRGAPS